jgi:hypothetical protein
MTRRWNPVNSTWTYSDLGREYYNVARQEVTVHMPITIRGVRVNGSVYTLDNAYMPITDDGVDQIYRPNGDANAVKQLVLAQFEGNEMIDGELLVHEASQEQWFLRDAPWRVSTMNTNPGEDPDVEVILQRPLGMLKTRLDHDLVIPEALIQRDDHTCVPRQMAVVLDIPYERICEEFDLIQPLWREKGVTSEAILKYANTHGITTTVLYQDKLLAKYNPPDRTHRKCMTYQIDGRHALFYKNPRVMIFREPLKKKLRKDSRECEVGYKPWQGEDEGTYWIDNLDLLRQDFMLRGICPKITVSEPHVLKSLTVGKLTLKREPKYGDEIREWLKTLGLPWCGEALPAASFKALQHLLKPKRKHLTDNQKEEILRQQEHKCSECEGPLDSVEFHHKIPLQNSVASQEFCAVCPECHSHFTFNQGPSNQNVLESCFEKNVYEQYVKSPKQKAIVYQPYSHQKRGEPLLLDIVRCRRNALYECVFDIPIFCPLDTIKSGSKLYDVSFVQKDVKWSGSALIDNLPFCGNSFYSKIAVQYMLHKGIIGWGNITHGIDASAHLPSTLLQAPLKKMEEAWPDTELGHDLRKVSINSLIGLMAIESNSLWCVKSTLQDESEFMGKYKLKTVTTYNDAEVIDYYFQTKLESGYRSLRPIHDVCLHTETTRLAQALHIIKALEVPAKDICTFKTDSINFYARKKRKAECLAIAETTFANLKKPKLLSQAECSSTNSNEKVYRIEEKVKPLGSNAKLPVIHTEVPQIETWEWIDHQPEAAIQLAMDGCSFCLEGMPGTGKTYLTNQIVEALREKGERVMCIAKTHVACSLLNGMTANAFVYKHVLNGHYKGWVVIDEFSLLDAQLWFILYRLIDYCKFICVGQWAQLPPVNGHTWLDSHLDDECIENSRMFHRMCGGNRITLTECKRSSPILFDWYTSIAKGGSRYERPWPEVLAEAKQFFDNRFEPDWTLCIDHELRKRINAMHNNRLKTDAVWIEVPKTKVANQPQDFWLYRGQVLVAHTHSSKKMKNGMFYTVTDFNEENVSFGTLVVSKAWVAKNCRLSHCLTISSSQGRTLHGNVLIISSHNRFTMKHLMICLSRATDAGKVWVI